MGFLLSKLCPYFGNPLNTLQKINLKVAAVKADGVSQNRKYFGMHKYLFGDSDADVIYRTKNIHTKEMRFIYLFEDAPHLVKTVRNCLYHSGSGRRTKYL